MLNLERLLLPMRETAAMHTTAMSATMRAYSTIVAPSSPDRRCICDCMRISRLEAPVDLRQARQNGPFDSAPDTPAVAAVVAAAD